MVSVFPTADGNAMVLAAYSKSNNCFYQIDNPGGNTSNAVVPFAANFTIATGATTVAAGAVTTAAAGTITFPAATAGSIYVEVKGDTLASDCSASAPKITAGGITGSSQIEWLQTQFPSL